MKMVMILKFFFIWHRKVFLETFRKPGALAAADRPGTTAQSALTSLLGGVDVSCPARALVGPEPGLPDDRYFTGQAGILLLI